VRARKKRHNDRQRAVRMNPSRCYLCGLPIPEEVVSPTHPLFGTVDHIVARKRNGSDAPYNLAPAHRVCNTTKGDHLIHPEEFAAELQQKVVPILERLGHQITRAVVKKANRYVHLAWPIWAPRRQPEAKGVALQRWEDDGGAVPIARDSARPGSAAPDAGAASSQSAG
jgi:hypothetical protein